MNKLFPFQKEQYEFVRQSRAVLLNYCSSINSDDFTNENSSFGRGGSVRNLLVHIANTYEFWVGKWALKNDMNFTSYTSIHNVDEVRLLFEKVDQMLNEFIELVENDQIKEIFFDINGSQHTVAPFKLFSHVITHEFHHKGQILSLSRHLGYVPVDTDIMR